MRTPHSFRSVISKSLVAATVFAGRNLYATLLFQDGLNYPAGILNSSDTSPAGTSGNAWSGGNANITVVNVNLTYNGLQDLGGNAVQDNWGVSAGTVINTYTAQTSGNIYYSFLLNCSVAPTTSTYLTALNPGTSSPNGSADALQVNVAANAGGFQIGLRTPGKSATLASMVLSLNTTYLVVAEYSFAGTGTATLYLNPTAGGSQPVTPDVTLAGNKYVTSIADLGFKAQTTGNTGTFLFDDLRVGTTWEDVTPIAAVPEPSAFALAGVALGALALRLRNSRR